MLVAGCVAGCSSGGGDCPEGIRFEGECLGYNCPDRDCPAGSVCLGGACVQEVCLGVECQDGEACAGGECLSKNCAERNCPGQGEVCMEAECVPAACVGVSCPPGQRCAGGECYPRDCPAQTCPGPGDVCLGDECVERTCLGVTCPPGQGCAGGYCYPRDCPEKACSEEGRLCASGTCRDPRCIGVVCRGDLVCSQGWCIEPGCNPQTCPEGCCDDSGCRQNSFSTCGVGGAACVDCAVYAERADACSAAGACICTATGTACGGGEVCTGSECCTPESDAIFCARLGYECDPATETDNCGVSRTVDCGDCIPPDTCSNNQCGCTPITCTQAGAECGLLSDGCGSWLFCGDCIPPESCNSSTNLCECASHDHSDCYLDDRYWYDACGNLEEIREACGFKCVDDACVECVVCTYNDLTCAELTGGCTSECLSQCQYTGETHGGDLCTAWELLEDCSAGGLCCDAISGCVSCR